MRFAGKDATEEFDMFHKRQVIKQYGIDQGTVTRRGKLANDQTSDFDLVTTNEHVRRVEH